MRTLVTIIGTFFYTGFFPVAPATFACLVFVLAYGLIPGGHILAHPLVMLATLVVSVPVSSRLEEYRGHDASCIVIDEIVGMQLVLTMAAPTTPGIAVGFLFFRLFDIVKPYPISRSQLLPRGWGVVADDVLAGVYARILLIFVARFYSGLGTFV
ncbi:MAG: phosphatidylglycerophosphatase A [Candidatus Latescibacterota bacterium]|nr:MAG: phosphatidylglycerophosphatase A [Candidatus Latescibacterota bacterium]